MRFVVFIGMLTLAVTNCTSHVFAASMPNKTEFELKVSDNVSVTVKISAVSYEEMKATREIIVDKLSRPKQCASIEQAPQIESQQVTTGYQKSSFHWQWEQ